MNKEEVMKLAREAGLRSAALLHIYGSREAALCDSEIEELRQIERFAALVVRECVNLNFRGTGFVTSEGEDMVRSMIKQHFGVEE